MQNWLEVRILPLYNFENLLHNFHNRLNFPNPQTRTSNPPTPQSRTSNPPTLQPRTSHHPTPQPRTSTPPTPQMGGYDALSILQFDTEIQLHNFPLLVFKLTFIHTYRFVSFLVICPLPPKGGSRSAIHLSISSIAL